MQAHGTCSMGFFISQNYENPYLFKALPVNPYLRQFLNGHTQGSVQELRGGRSRIFGSTLVNTKTAT